MKNEKITELYQYYSNVDYAINVIRDAKLFCSKAKSFNDPFDGSIPFDIDDDPSDFVAAAYRTYKKDGHDWSSIKSILTSHLCENGELSADTKSLIKNTAEEFKKQNENAGIVCLTEDPLSVLMWSHYANKHKGVCIGFQRSADNDLGDDDACIPVTYSDSYPAPKFSQIYESTGSLTEALLFTKAKKWAYEKEWRLMVDEGDAFGKLPGEIISVILGCRFPDENLLKVREACGKKGIKLFRAIQSPTQFALDLVPDDSDEAHDIHTENGGSLW
jgi:hypothetical protein